MKRKKPYLPNNWKQYKDQDDSFFSLGGQVYHTFEDFMDWKVDGWLLPSSITCIIREENPKNGRVKEYTYQTEGHAKRKVKKLLADGKSFTICDNDGITYLTNKPINKYTS